VMILKVCLDRRSSGQIRPPRVALI
jgi:hypothetical protein